MKSPNDKETYVRGLTAVVLLLAVTASACQIRTDIAIEIRADETGTVAFELGFDEELRQLAESEGGDVSFEGLDGFAGAAPDGWAMSEFDDGEFAGTRISTPFSSLDDLDAKLAAVDTGSDDPTANFFDSIGVERDGETFRFEATLAELDEAVADAGDFDFGIDPTQFLSDIFLIRFIVTMPGEITSHNADTIDGSTLVWEVPLDGASRTLSAVSGSSGGFPMLLLFVALGGIGMVGALWLIVQRRRREIDTVMYGEPAGHIISQGEGETVGADPFAD